LRFNRTLLIESANGFDKLFRPYHFADKIIDPRRNLTRYNYVDWTAWSSYDSKLCCNERTEYNLQMCLNTHSSVCGMDAGDKAHPIIKIRSNRLVGYLVTPLRY
jgi:hypothetical protein